jgi:hypothetical protein
MVVLWLLLSEHFAFGSNLADMILFQLEKLFRFGNQTLEQQVLHCLADLGSCGACESVHPAISKAFST